MIIPMFLMLLAVTAVSFINNYQIRKIYRDGFYVDLDNTYTGRHQPGYKDVDEGVNSATDSL